MSVIDKIMSHEVAKWVNRKILELPDSAKYRASNSIRFLNWANSIYESGLPVPACYCALHATEEAVAAFISCAKECGYGNDAKINIKDHRAKATISILTEKVSNILQQYSPAVAHNPRSDFVAARLTVDGKYIYDFASLNLMYLLDKDKNMSGDFYDHILHLFADTNGLKEAVVAGQEARNKIFYADSLGIPTGFNVPEQSLERECQISLGLIWAAIDINRQKGNLIPFVVQALRTANIIIAEVNIKK